MNAEIETNRAMMHDGVLGCYRPIGNGMPALTSANAGWRGICLEHYRQTPLEIEEGFLPETVVILHLGPIESVQFRDNGVLEVGRVRAGEATIVPSGGRYSIRSGEASEWLLLSLDRATMTCAASEFGRSEDLMLKMRVGVSDQMVRAVLLSLKGELESSGSTGGRTYAESLSHTLATHLVKSYSGGVAESRVVTDGLPRHLLRRALEFIYENSTADVTLKQIAESVSMSPFHFSRLFKQSVGEPPYRHLLRHRVRRGAEMLMTGRAGVARIATELGFVDQSHFALHFKKFYGMTPTAFSRSREGIAV